MTGMTAMACSATGSLVGDLIGATSIGAGDNPRLRSADATQPDKLNNRQGWRQICKSNPVQRVGLFFQC